VSAPSQAAAGIPPQTGARVRRLLAIVLVFILCGPPVGALVFMLAVAVVGMGNQADLGGLTWVALFAIIYAIPFGYLIGFTPALAAGLIVGVRQAFFGPATWWFALGAGLAVGVGFQLATGQPLLPPADTDMNMREQGPIMILTCACSTLVCWSLVRGWYFAQRIGRSP
jgi:hypothetical protein